MLVALGAQTLAMFLGLSSWAVVVPSWAALRSARATGDAPSCLAGRATNPTYARRLDGSYEVHVGPVAGESDPAEACQASVVDRTGATAFRVTGFGVIYEDQVSGRDIDGDGAGDVVFRVDSGGGQHCCWSYSIISLRPRPRKLFDIDAAGRVRFTADRRGKIVIWQRVPGPAGYTDLADRPFAERVLRVKSGTLVDVTPEFCGQILTQGNKEFDEQQRWLTPEKLKVLTAGAGAPEQEVASALWSRILQNVYCHRPREALNDLNLWPDVDRAKKDLWELIKDDEPRFAAHLMDASIALDPRPSTP